MEKIKTIFNKPEKSIAKKIVLSVVFGLIGFWINFHAVNFLQFHDFKVSILFGLFFPLFIAMMWGWKYGLLSALAGGCQSMWWLWFGDGWGFLYAVPVFTLWIVWHGFWADFRRSHEHRWYFSMYIVEIPFRIVIELGYYVIFRWLVSLNPPPWAPHITTDFVSVSWVNLVVIKHVITGYILLLICDVFSNIGPIRKFFLPDEKIDYHHTTYIVSAAILIGGLFWLIHATMDFLVFYRGQGTFLDLMFVKIPKPSLFSMNLFILIALLIGMILSRIQKKLHRKDIALQKRNEERDKILNSILSGLYIYNFETLTVNYLNNEYTVITGWTLEDIQNMGDSLSDLFHPDDRKNILTSIQRIYELKKDKVIHIEYQFKTKSGDWIWLESYNIPFERDKEGNVTKYIGTFIDITKNKKAEEELNKYKEHLEEVVNERTLELAERNKELEEFNELFKGREFRIKDLRDEVKALKEKLGEYEHN